MRIRSFKPEFFRDARLAALPDAVRLFYMGLWAVADDNGWLRWNPQEIGADLYPYRAVRARERQVTQWGQRLVAEGRLAILDCGHAEVPTLRQHQKRGGHPVETVEREHLNQCLGETVTGPGARPKEAKPAGSPPEPAEARPKPHTGGEVRGGIRESRGRVREGEDEPSLKRTNGGDVTTSVLAAAREAIQRHESGEMSLAPEVEAAIRRTLATHEGEAST